MKRVLGVVRDSNNEESTEKMLREAGELVSGVDGELVILKVADIGEYEEKREAIESSSGAQAFYSIEQEEEAIRKQIKKLAEKVFDGIDINYKVDVRVGKERREIFEAVDEHDSDHVFMVGKNKSPAGKALFGDLAQTVVLNFDGPVTVLTE